MTGEAAFRLGPIPVRIQPWFWVMAILLGIRGRLPSGSAEWIDLALWVAVVLVSVMVHELGHALTARAFGLEPSVTLHMMGGLTSFKPGVGESSRGRMVLITLAGPFAGFLVGGIVLAVTRFVSVPAEGPLQTLVRDLLWVNFGWGVVNLLPVVPLDGGHVMQAALAFPDAEAGRRRARIVSIVVAVVVAIGAAVLRQVWIAILFAFFAYQAWAARSVTKSDDHGRPIIRGQD